MSFQCHDQLNLSWVKALCCIYWIYFVCSSSQLLCIGFLCNCTGQISTYIFLKKQNVCYCIRAVSIQVWAGFYWHAYSNSVKALSGEIHHFQWYFLCMLFYRKADCVALRSAVADVQANLQLHCPHLAYPSYRTRVKTAKCFMRIARYP